MEYATRLQQIEKIAQNARTAWFGLLALLLFVGVTLMGHEDSDFFAFGADTDLPFVSISVPPSLFFIVAPMLTSALYIYLHIYLGGLWTALSKCPAHIEDVPIEEYTYPTMLCTTALVFRRALRHEPFTPVDGPRHDAVTITLLMIWLFGPVVLGFLWYYSMPYHSEWLSIWNAWWFWLALIIGAKGLFQLVDQMRDPGATFSEFQPFHKLRSLFLGPIKFVFLFAFVAVSWERTESGHYIPLASANLRGAELSKKPKNWLGHDAWMEDWKEKFRERERIYQWTDEKIREMSFESRQRWLALTQSLDSPDLRDEDLRGADLRGAFLSGAKLDRARLEKANLEEASLEGATFHEAEMSWADLGDARLQAATLSGAKLRYADFVGAHMDLVDLSSADMESASFFVTRMREANLTDARLNSARLTYVDLEGADLSDASMEQTDIRNSNLTNVEGLTQEMVNAAFGGPETILPEGIVVPCHWTDKPSALLSILESSFESPDPYLKWTISDAKPIPRNPDGTCPQ